MSIGKIIGSAKDTLIDYYDTDKDKEKQSKTSLNEFVSGIKKHGLARTHLYAVEIPIANSMKGFFVEPDDSKFINLLCSSVSLPGFTYFTNEHRTIDEKREIIYEKLYDPLQMTFYVDSEMDVRYFFESWMNSMNLQGGKTFEFYDNYVTDVKIYILTPSGEKCYEVILKEVYPKVLSSISLDYSSKETIMTQQVTFSYHTFESIQLDVFDNAEGIKSILDNIFGGNSLYESSKALIQKYSEIINTVDTFVSKTERIKGEVGNIINKTRSIPGLAKSKVTRVKDLGKF